MTSGLRPRLLVLGAGHQQLGLIRRASDRGIEVVVADYLPDSPGKVVADHATMASSVDIAACVEVARQYKVNGVTTFGTDLPVVTMAEVAARMDLPCYLSPSSARAATDKQIMADLFEREGVQPNRSVTVRPGDPLPSKLAPTLVVKPADSQGQRGIAKVERRRDLSAAVAEAARHSRDDRAIVEPFVEGSEITVNGWVADGIYRTIAINDRVTYNPLPAIGLAYRHVFPSRHPSDALAEADRLAGLIAKAYELESGPVYAQMLVGKEGIHVVEAAARVGGGHEAELIPAVVGFNLVDRVIDLALPDSQTEVRVDPPSIGPAGTVTFMFSARGVIAHTETPPRGPDQWAGLYVREGDEVRRPRNGTDRVGYAVAIDGSREAAIQRADLLVSKVTLNDSDGRRLIVTPPNGDLLGVE